MPVDFRMLNFYFERPYIFQINELIYKTNILNEGQHVYKGSQDAIEDISKRIFSDFKNNKTISFRTGYSFVSNYGVIVPFTETKNINSKFFKSFPIRIEYKYLSNVNLYFYVNDRAEFPYEIVITTNVYAISEYLESSRNEIQQKKQSGTFNDATDNDYDYCLIETKLKHEMLHVRQNYGLTDNDVSQTRKMVNTDIEHLFDYGYKNEQAYDIVQKYMYIFGFSELSQRINEASEVVNTMRDDMLDAKLKNSHSRTDACVYMFNYTQNKHLTQYMIEMKKDMEDTLYAKVYSVVLPIAYFFMFYNMFKTKLKISKEHVQKVIYDESKANKNDLDFCKEFIVWLNNLIYDFRANVYTAIHYVLYVRLWESSDIERYNLTRRNEILSKEIKYRHSVEEKA